MYIHWKISLHFLFQTRFTTKQRTAASAFAFVDGLFGTGMGLEFPEALDKDMLIKVIIECSCELLDCN
jgi:hypothetical protein